MLAAGGAVVVVDAPMAPAMVAADDPPLRSGAGSSSARLGVSSSRAQ